MRKAIEYVTVSPGCAGCARTWLTSFATIVFGPFGPPIDAPGCATAHSRPLSVTMPLAVVALVERATSATENGAATATPAVAMTT